MKRRLLLLLAASVCVSAEKKKKQKVDEKKPPDLQVIKMDVRRGERMIELDGVVKNGSVRPFKGVTIFFEFLDGDKKLVSRRSIEVTRLVVEPNEEVELEAQTPDQARVVYFLLDAEDKDGRYLTLDKPGPHLVE